MEPYKIKTTEPIFITTRKERKTILQKAHLNLFLIPARFVMIDLLTDSGTGAMSAQQWGNILTGDESYAGAESFYFFEHIIKSITGMNYIIPVHQGRAAERILMDILKTQGKYIVSNTLFDTTRANAEQYGFKTQDLPDPKAQNLSSQYSFKGNIHLPQLEKTLKTKPVAAVILTITNNSGGGQPVSFANIKKCSAICKKYKTPLVLDACRFAENAWLIKQKEPGFQHKSPATIAKAVFDTADMCFVSAKKDGLANIGGFIGVRKDTLSEQCKNQLILAEGFPTYGGLAGRDLAAVAQGFKEALEPSYLRHRINTIKQLHQRLVAGNVPVLHPPGGHAVYIDAKALLSHIPKSQYPGQALVAGLYEFAGIRSCEIGSIMMGQKLKNGRQIYHTHELVRLAIPRRVYTESHLNYVADSIIAFANKEASQLKGIQFTKEPDFLRHFTAHFQWAPKTSQEGKHKIN